MDLIFLETLYLLMGIAWRSELRMEMALPMEHHQLVRSIYLHLAIQPSLARPFRGL